MPGKSERELAELRLEVRALKARLEAQDADRDVLLAKIDKLLTRVTELVGEDAVQPGRKKRHLWIVPPIGAAALAASWRRLTPPRRILTTGAAALTTGVTALSVIALAPGTPTGPGANRPPGLHLVTPSHRRGRTRRRAIRPVAREVGLTHSGSGRAPARATASQGSQASQPPRSSQPGPSPARSQPSPIIPSPLPSPTRLIPSPTPRLTSPVPVPTPRPTRTCLKFKIILGVKVCVRT